MSQGYWERKFKATSRNELVYSLLVDMARSIAAKEKPHLIDGERVRFSRNVSSPLKMISSQARLQRHETSSDRLELTEMNLWGPPGNVMQRRAARAARKTNRFPSISYHSMQIVHAFIRLKYTPVCCVVLA
jgi:hypothetical protein